MSDCIFCKISSQQIPANIVYQDDQMMAFLDIHPVRPGHLLLIPREHVPTMLEAGDQLVAQLFQKARDLMQRMKDRLGADFVMLYIVGVDVPHFHIHLLPRNTNDGLIGWPTQEYQPGEAEGIVAKLQ